jgi:hypothetical protein
MQFAIVFGDSWQRSLSIKAIPLMMKKSRATEI